MKEIFNTNCIVMMSRVQSILNDHEIVHHTNGYNISALFGHSVGLLPISLMVGNDDYWDAARILRMEKITPSCDMK
jgi:hypothetical protein